MPRLTLNGTEVEVDESVIKKFDSLPGAFGSSFTDEQKALLLAYWPTKRHVAVAKCLGVSVDTALRWYRSLTEEVNS
jgi:hypothetical protein